MYAESGYVKNGLDEMVVQYGFDSETAQAAKKDELSIYALEYGIDTSVKNEAKEDVFEINRLTSADIL